MKKLMFFLLSITIIILIITLEGGRVAAYMQLSAFLLVTLGILFSTMFSFSFKEIRGTFMDSFSEKTDATKLNIYKRGYIVSKLMSKLSIYWSLIGVLLGIIYVLSHLETPERLGVGLAMALVSALYGLIYSGTLFIPMGHVLIKKIQDIKEN
ncbi:MAG: MotA/TolQ/ExbB proton channel family protein [Solirubrobacterales bacterium]